ncbi:MAG: 50S ribosomal protein L5 [Patescibacteria group bacterium]
MAEKTMTTVRMKELYMNQYAKELLADLKLRNLNQVPKLQKIVLNIGLGRAKEDKKTMEVAANTLRKITGQEPVETFARMSIATFKLREGMKIGLKVTLRGPQMYEFLDRIITIVLPRVRDFHGVSLKAFDEQGNYSLGLTDQSVFPELSFEETTTLHGLQMIFVIDNGSPENSKALLEKFDMPFEKFKVPEEVVKPIHIPAPPKEVTPEEAEVTEATEKAPEENTTEDKGEDE